MFHELKLSIQYFNDVENRIKNFEIRKNDRNYKVGDKLFLREVYYDNIGRPFCTGKWIIREIIYVFDDPNYMCNDYVILGLK